MDLTARVDRHFDESAALHHTALEALGAPIVAAIHLLTACLINNGKILACGNGGSANNAEHFAVELLDHFEAERQELAAIALSANSALLTAAANNHGFAAVFAKQVRALGQPGDVLLAISASGNSESVVEAVRTAKAHDMQVVALTGAGGGQLAALLDEADVLLAVPATRPARVQEAHLLIIHCLCDGIDALLLGVE